MLKYPISHFQGEAFSSCPLIPQLLLALDLVFSISKLDTGEGRLIKLLLNKQVDREHYKNFLSFAFRFRGVIQI